MEKYMYENYLRVEYKITNVNELQYLLTKVAKEFGVM